MTMEEELDRLGVVRRRPKQSPDPPTPKPPDPRDMKGNWFAQGEDPPF